jgi:hypothetical protein
MTGRLDPHRFEPKWNIDSPRNSPEDGDMSTMLELPDDLVRSLEWHASRAGRPLGDFVEAVLREQFRETENAKPAAKTLPFIKARPVPSVQTEMSAQEWCDWLKEMDLQFELEHYEKASGHQHVDRAVD